MRPDKRIRIMREPQRGRYDRETIDAILDEALLCHLGFEVDGQPYVIPTLHARVGDTVYVHGSAASRMLRHLAGGVRVCLTVTLFDGLVLARSVFNHSVNYRSVVLLGTATLDRRRREARGAAGAHRAARAGPLGRGAAADREGAEGDVDPLAPDRRGVREGAQGPPEDDPEDEDLPVWAGVVPVHLAAEPSEYDWKRVHDGRVGGPEPADYDEHVSTFEHHVLDNGLRVLTAPMPQAQSVTCMIMLAAGSRYETPDTNGIAHFSEHMFFKGTERRPSARDIAGEIDAIGGEFNAFTGKEYTAYYVKCAAEHRDVALDVLVDMLRNSRFDAEEIDREKGVIVEEMNMYFDTPRDYIGGVYEELLYGDQPLGWDIIGRKETVRGATRDTFTSYLDRWYHPPRMVLGVGGRIGDGLLERAQELLGDLPRGDDRRAGAGDAVRERPRQGLHEAVRPGARLSSACRAIRSSIPTATRSRCSRPCSAAACRRASSPRCASGAASPTTSSG